MSVCGCRQAVTGAWPVLQQVSDAERRGDIDFAAGSQAEATGHRECKRGSRSGVDRGRGRPGLLQDRGYRGLYNSVINTT